MAEGTTVESEGTNSTTISIHTVSETSNNNSHDLLSMSTSPPTTTKPTKETYNNNNNNNNNNEVVSVGVKVPLLNHGNVQEETENNETPPHETQVPVVSTIEIQVTPADEDQVDSSTGPTTLGHRQLKSTSSDEVVDGTRRHSKSSSLPHGVKLCPETNGSGPSPDSTPSIVEEKWVKLEEELKKAQDELKEKDDEVEKLKGIRQQVEEELDDLTSSLFVVSPSEIFICAGICKGTG